MVQSIPSLVLSFAASLLCVSAALPAQSPSIQQPTTLVVPAHLATQEGISTGTIAGLSSSFRQQILVHRSHLQPMLGQAITGLWFRRDDMFGKPYLPGTSQLLLEVSTAAQPLAAPSPVFASNHGTNRTIVFQGAIALPPSQGAPIPAPFDAAHAVRLPFTTPFTYQGGDLCLQIEGAPINPLPRLSWWVDYEQESSGGIVTPIGQPCGPATAEHATTAHAHAPSLTPGSTLWMHTVGAPGTSGVLMLGTALAAPVSLTPLGAPGCDLWLQPLVQLGGVHPGPAIGNFSALPFDVMIPATPQVLAARFRMQGANLDPAANPAGLTTTEALDLTLAGQMPPATLSMVTSDLVVPGNPFSDTGRVWVSRGPVLLFEY